MWKNLWGQGRDGNGACRDGAGIRLRERDGDEILSPCKNSCGEELSSAVLFT